MKRISSLLIVFILFSGSSLLHAQDNQPDHENKIQFQGRSKEHFSSLFHSFDSLIIKGEGIINILHLGDSHIQADFFPGQVRQRLVAEIASGCGARGLLFPYRMARSNNPVDYFVKYTGTWESCRNVEYSKSCRLGLTGIMVRTKDSLPEFTFHFRDTNAKDFNSVRIYHDENSYSFEFPGLEGSYTLSDDNPGVTRIDFREFHKDSLRIKVSRRDTANKYFTLFGVVFENGDAGITYNSAGVNGAEVISFLRCDLLPEQISVMKPDLVVVSLGTNDAYPVKFDKLVFKENYKELIRKIRNGNTGLPVLLTIPGDSYRKRRYVNKNLPILREAVLEVARETDCAVWDFFSIMGGTKSIQKWFKAGLVAKDKLHFNKAGYILQGNLFSDALIDSYSTFIDQSK